MALAAGDRAKIDRVSESLMCSAATPLRHRAAAEVSSIAHGVF
jgi:hypothetical protein